MSWYRSELVKILIRSVIRSLFQSVAKIQLCRYKICKYKRCKMFRYKIDNLIREKTWLLSFFILHNFNHPFYLSDLLLLLTFYLALFLLNFFLSLYLPRLYLPSIASYLRCSSTSKIALDIYLLLNCNLIIKY